MFSNMNITDDYYCTRQRLFESYRSAARLSNKTFLQFTNTSGNNLTNNNNSSSLESNNQYSDDSKLFQLIVRGYLTTTIAIFGIIGNMISTIILTRPKMKTTSLNHLLLNLTFCDTILIINTIFIFGLNTISYHLQFKQYTEIFIPNILPYMLPIGTTSYTGSVYFTILVTIERFLAVYYPLKCKYICTLRRARFVSVLVVLFSILYNVPKWFEFGTRQTGPSSYEVYLTDFRCNSNYIKVYINWCNLFVMYLLPISCLVVLNCVIYLQIRRTNATRQVLTKNQSQELSLAMMLIVIVLVYLVCNILPFVNNFMESMTGDPKTELVDISNFLVTFNSSVNCIIYCTLGVKFRKHFFLLLYCYRGKGARMAGDSLYGASGYRGNTTIRNGQQQHSKRQSSVSTLKYGNSSNKTRATICSGSSSRRGHHGPNNNGAAAVCKEEGGDLAAIDEDLGHGSIIEDCVTEVAPLSPSGLTGGRFSLENKGILVVPKA